MGKVNKDNKRKEDFKLLIRALRYLHPYKLQFILALVTILGNIGINLITPYLWGKTLEYLFKKDLHTILFYLALSFILDLIGIGINYAQSYLMTRLNQYIVFNMKKDIYESLLNLPVKAYNDIDNGEFMSRLHGDASQVAHALTGTLTNSLVDVVRAIGVGIAGFALNAKLALLILCGFPFIIFVSRYFGRKIREANKVLAKKGDAYFGSSCEGIWGIREIKSFGIKKQRFADFLYVAEDLRDTEIKMMIWNALSVLSTSGINTIMRYLIMLLGGILVVQGRMDAAIYVTFISYSGQFLSSLLSISNINLDIQQVMTSLERMFLLVDGLGYGKEKFGNQKPDSIRGTIAFKNVSFAYKENEEVLDNISIEIPEKKRTAFVGCSGSGKSTIFNLILRMYQPSQGNIMLDNIAIEELTEDTLRDTISVVSQEPFLFSMTIKENLQLIKPDATQKEIEEACEHAYIYDYIESLPDKWDTKLGENGINLSGGQRQRLAIARVLLKKSKIILFDEATSALDNESQFYIKKAMDEIADNCTVVTIAHRLSTIIESDIIYVIHQGKVVGCGTHRDLIHNNTFYQNLYKAEVDLINENSEEG